MRCDSIVQIWCCSVNTVYAVYVNMNTSLCTCFSFQINKQKAYFTQISVHLEWLKSQLKMICSQCSCLTLLALEKFWYKNHRNGWDRDRWMEKIEMFIGTPWCLACLQFKIIERACNERYICWHWKWCVCACFFFSFRCFVCIYLTMVIHSKFAVTIF